ncbi:subtilisin-like protease SBT4.3 [Quercus lobata]|uniref:subtilisin-like protease SBT4.3 n=1 Tax=Quercus lobata TaxID=97700 RepID=UPI0012472112|nr:subtilisin-like protease SBT4.3 [Quercus lobata]
MIQVYIVYMGSLPTGQYSPLSNHLSLLQEVVEGSSIENCLVRSYKRSFNGFAAKLTDRERQKLANRNEVVSVFPSKPYHLHTTRSWDFLGFSETIKRNATAESDVIVGVIDTGIWPESESFNDEGFSPHPSKWKGECKGGNNFTCNNKIIGARYYSSTSSDNMSARDHDGHGTHTASTAAGNKVEGASFYGIAQGTARGGVPSARIAAYRACYPNDCQGEKILAAFDDAIADGVDIISISIGPYIAVANFSQDVIAIGAFHAMEKGILTSQSAGNSAGLIASVSSVAPWIFCVAASNIDRQIIDKVVLGNGKTLDGIGINGFSLNGTKFPLVLGQNARKNTCSTSTSEGVCNAGCLNSSLVIGKIVVCDDPDADFEASIAGAVGSILKNDPFDDIADVFSLPTSSLSVDKYDIVASYLNSTKEPQATILRSESIQVGDAPIVAWFSSLGPNYVVPEILKPDITAPGVEILAAYSEIVSPSSSSQDMRRAKYNILSGTSMACPHVSGVAAYVKTFHPDWSASAIKSAIMTTASPMNATEILAAEFAYGSGQINPTKAVDPGLVYNASKEDYINLLCSLGYDEKNLRLISGDNSTCPKVSTKTLARDLNYPSMTAMVSPLQSFNVTFHRTVTNVGFANSTYKATTFTNSEVKIIVEPEVISFTSVNEKSSFVVHVTGGQGILPNNYSKASSSLVWSDGSHSVRSPVFVYALSN